VHTGGKLLPERQGLPAIDDVPSLRPPVMGRLHEFQILARIAAKLRQLGCPDVRRAEGTEEWRRTQGAFRFTPDLVAGPLRGGGDPRDFYIDVFSPTGEQFVNAKAGAPKAATVFRQAVEGRGSFSFGELGGEFEPFLGPINKKLGNYSTSRNGSPMVGIGMYFCLSGNSFVGPILAFFNMLRALDAALGLTAGPQGADMRAALDQVLGPGNTASIIVHPLPVQVSFLMVHADKLARDNASEKTVFIINSGVVHEEFDLREHPVVAWLRSLAYEPVRGERHDGPGPLGPFG
jgi:hypothetical protein